MPLPDLRRCTRRRARHDMAELEREAKDLQRLQADLSHKLGGQNTARQQNKTTALAPASGAWLGSMAW